VADPIERLHAIAAELPPPPSALHGYVRTVRERAYAVTDADVEALRAEGISEDEIFEQTVGAAVGEGLRRLGAARRVLGT
jgi:alkylhydroperoxidase family enzyme